MHQPVERFDERTTERGTEPAMVHADATRLEQVVWNLLSNAIKFTPEGGTISVSVSVVDGFAKLVVKDDGQGIDPDFLPRIFDMFGQAPGRALHGRAGLGIGLSLVRQLVTRHGGYELVAALRKSDRFAELPVVALTGFGRESDADRATDAGFNAHLSKPVAIDELIELFRKLRAPTTDA